MSSGAQAYGRPESVVDPEELAGMDPSPARMCTIPGSRMFEIREALAVFRKRHPGELVFDASQGDGGASLPGERGDELFGDVCTANRGIARLRLRRFGGHYDVFAVVEPAGAVGNGEGASFFTTGAKRRSQGVAGVGVVTPPRCACTA
jgi:hypothetical protein